MQEEFKFSTIYSEEVFQFLHELRKKELKIFKEKFIEVIKEINPLFLKKIRITTSGCADRPDDFHYFTIFNRKNSKEIIEFLIQPSNQVTGTVENTPLVNVFLKQRSEGVLLFKDDKEYFIEILLYKPFLEYMISFLLSQILKTKNNIEIPEIGQFCLSHKN